MKHVVQAIFCLLVIVLSCKKGEDEPNPPNDTDTGGVSLAFDQLQFFHSTKITGAVPITATNATLKKSFKDTLVLFEDLQTPFRLLHEDVSQDVAGIFVSVDGSPYYYDVPELADSKTNATVSVFTMGFAKSADDLPETFEVTMTPYNKSRQPVARFKTKVKRKKVSDIDVNGFCGLALEIDEYWDWELSYIPGLTDSGTIKFINYPLKVWGAAGQEIKGSCCGRSTSIYGLCPGADSANRSLHFNTFFGFPYEQFTFRSTGSFARKTAQISGKPDLDNSNWCTNYAETDTSIQLVDYAGNWSVSVRSVPAGLHANYTSREYLSLQTTSSQGGLGYGNPGGFIHILQCGGYLWLIQPDMERSDMHLYKFYMRKKENEEVWHVINVQ